MSAAETIRLYLDEQRRILDDFPVPEVERVAAMLFETYDEGGTVYAMANGGNAGTLDHFFCDFTHHPFVSEGKDEQMPADVRRLRFVNLSSSAAALTGLANDLGRDAMYTAALEPFVRPRDLVMAFSGSGNSPNVVNALEAAVKAGARTFAMTKGGGGRCRQLAEVCLVVPGSSRFPGQTGSNDNNFHFEDAMLSLNHILVGLLKERVAGAGTSPPARERASRATAGERG